MSVRRSKNRLERPIFVECSKYHDAAGDVRMTNRSNDPVFFILLKILSPNPLDKVSDISGDA